MSQVHSVRRRISPHLVLVPALTYLIIAWSLVYVIDVFNVAGLRDWTFDIGLDTPGFWYSLFQEGGPTEMLQWLTLGAAALVAGALVGGMIERGEPRAQIRFWLIMAVAFSLLLIEDAGDPRFKFAQYATSLTGSATGGHVVEFMYYVAIASIPLYALVRYGWSVWTQRESRTYLLIGFALYAIAGGTSAIRYVGDWYKRSGALVHEYLLLGRVERADIYNSHEFWLMDCLMEETVELLAATMFLAAAVAFLTNQHRRKPDLRVSAS